MAPPKYLYKYRSLSGEACKHTRVAIRDLKFFFASPPEINDPFEFRFRIEAQGSHREWTDFMRAMYTRQEATMSPWDATLKAAAIIAQQQPAGMVEIAESFPAALWESLESDAGVLSLTSEPMDIRMWSYYADKHCGVCLQLDTTKARGFFEEVEPVSYQPNVPKIDCFRFLEEETLHKVFLTKSVHWCYEKEWRIIRVPGGRGPVLLPPDALVGMVFGCRTSNANISMVKQWISESAAVPTLSIARQDEQRYSIHIEPYPHAG